MLDAVERGLFHVCTMGHVRRGIALLTGEASGMSQAGCYRRRRMNWPEAAATVEDTVMQRAERRCGRIGGLVRWRGHGGRSATRQAMLEPFGFTKPPLRLQFAPSDCYKTMDTFGDSYENLNQTNLRLKIWTKSIDRIKCCNDNFRVGARPMEEF